MVRGHGLRLLRTMMWGAAGVLALPLLYGAVAGVLMLWPPAARLAPEPAEVEAYVISNGVHVDLVLPLQAAGVDWRPLFPPGDARAAPAAVDFVAIGWGDRAFYLHTPTWADLRPGLALRAMAGRHPAALHVSWLQRAQLPPGHTWRLPLSAAQYRRLADHVRRSLPAGRAQRIAGMHYARNDAFYEATGHYHLLRTCNEWAAQGLRAAGVPVPRWAPFEAGVRRHLPAWAAAPGAGPQGGG
ncbi:TIGR02117 family protein [Xenophilus sp. Marseille-Q4582]|uniref:TIGR02117 family protein n=1 Tax=Xenophilus sp. Marseille-Q4582 TaxID=2866600 RepID=UPI001CE3BAC6|nr:TIGR02117 family protein [Xenophilus sp. Marseille-Q4582]